MRRDLKKPADACLQALRLPREKMKKAQEARETLERLLAEKAK